MEAYFKPTEEDRENGKKVPSKAHLAVAELVKRGCVRVIITTNFDKLTEQALEAVGVSPQVIHHADMVKGMKPLAHAEATVIKLHGDYLDLGTRNTPGELDSYPDEWNTLIAEVLDYYGLVISGWSADWDKALVRLIESTPNRRYPLYWDSRSSQGDIAQQLRKNRDGHIITAVDAHSLFTKLLADVDALDRLAQPPLTTAMAVARLKKYLPDPVRRIDLLDLVMDTVDTVAAYVRSQPVNDLTEADYGPMLDKHWDVTVPLLHLVANGVWYDDATHDQLWLDGLQRLLDSTTTTLWDLRIPEFDALRRYPALLTQCVLSIAAIARRREHLVLRSLTDTHGRVSVQTVPGYEALHPYEVLSFDWVNGLSRWGGRGSRSSCSVLIRHHVRDAFASLIPEDDDFRALTWAWEHRIGLVHVKHEPRVGVFIGDATGEVTHYASLRTPELPCETDFTERQRLAITWPWNGDFLGDPTSPDYLPTKWRARAENAWQTRPR